MAKRISILFVWVQLLLLLFMLATALIAQSNFDANFLVQHQQLLNGQTVQDIKIQHLQDNIEDLNKAIQEIKDLDLQKRLVRLESTGETNYHLLMAILLCVGTIAIKSIIDGISKAVKH